MTSNKMDSQELSSNMMNVEMQKGQVTDWENSIVIMGANQNLNMEEIRKNDGNYSEDNVHLELKSTSSDSTLTPYVMCGG